MGRGGTVGVGSVAGTEAVQREGRGGGERCITWLGRDRRPQPGPGFSQDEDVVEGNDDPWNDVVEGRRWRWGSDGCRSLAACGW